MEIDIAKIIAGLATSLVGLGIIGSYTWVNRKSRQEGVVAHWVRGWILAVPGMGAIVAGWIILSFADPRIISPLVNIPGWIVLGSGVGLYVFSQLRVGRLVPLSKYSLQLYTGGIYHWVRHPQALALCLVSVGLGLGSGSIPFLLLLPLWIGSWVAYTYLEEHFELIPTFGDEYLRYREQTSRILPRIRLRRNRLKRSERKRRRRRLSRRPQKLRLKRERNV